MKKQIIKISVESDGEGVKVMVGLGWQINKKKGDSGWTSFARLQRCYLIYAHIAR